jgi:fatty acid-binding protein DegV
MHGDADQDARELVDRIQQEYHPVEMISDITGPVLGIHTGPRAIGLAGYWEE